MTEPFIFENQLAMFIHIWMTRPHFSEVSGNPLGNEMMSYFFSHVLSKGAEPAAKLDQENILLMTLEEHQTWENHKYDIRNHPDWRHVFKREEYIKIKYNAARG